MYIHRCETIFHKIIQMVTNEAASMTNHLTDPNFDYLNNIYDVVDDFVSSKLFHKFLLIDNLKLQFLMLVEDTFLDKIKYI